MKQRLLPTLLALCMALALLPGTARAEKVFYPVNDDDTIYFDTATGAITYCPSRDITEVILPSEINGVAVTSIAEVAFANCESLINVSIPDSVTTIGLAAFDGCISLSSITIPDSVTTIGKHAFESCDNLASITLSNGITRIETGVFNNCPALASVTIPDSVTSIGNNAFSMCSSLTSVIIPDGVTTIEKSTFFGCNALTSVTIPNSVTTIEWSAFDGCSSLTSVTIPNSVTTIGEGAFSGCSSLTSVTISSSINTIGDGAFSGCSKLSDVYYSGSEADWKAVRIGKINNDPLLNATIHYADTDTAAVSDTTPEPAPTAQEAVAIPTASTVQVNGGVVAFDAYNIGGNNYFKLRDLAYVLNGTSKQFEVSWDASANAIALLLGQPYTLVGGELEGKGAGNQTAKPTASKIFQDGQEVSFTAYNIGGNNYFKLRDVGEALDFGVVWDAASQTIAIDTSTGYSPN